MLKRYLPVSSINLSALILCFFISATLQAQSQWANKVATKPVTLSKNNVRFNGIGTSVAKTGIEIYPSVTEQVTKVLFQAEQKVKAGDLLVDLDNRAEQLGLKSAQIRLAEATRMMDQYSRALTQNAVPKTDLDASKAEFQQAQIALQQAQIALDDRQIRAPFTGIVGRPLIDPGDHVTESTQIATLDDRSQLYVDFEIPETLQGYLNTLDIQTSFLLTTPALPHEEFKASLKSISSRVDPLKRTLEVRLVLDNPDDRFKPGMSFKVFWFIAGPEVFAVPEIALQWSQEGSYIWRVEDFVVKKVPIKVLSRKAGQILVEGQLQQDDQVVVEGVQRMREGLEVCILEVCAKGVNDEN